MANPFKQVSAKNITEEFSIRFTSFIKNQLEAMVVGDSINIDTRGKAHTRARSTIHHLSNENFKFTTKTDKQGNLWVLRIK